MVWRVQPLKLLVLFLVVAGVILSSAVDADAARKKKKRTRHVAPPAPYVEKYAAIVLEASSGRILYERMSNEARYPASLTKMMTLYLLFEQLQKGAVTLSTPLTASQYACSQEPTRLGLKPGDQVTVEDAVKALVVRSANDVAVMIAEHLGGSEYAFASRMTQKARELGMARTTFANASGLPDTSQKSTAWDLALLSRRLVTDFPQFYPYFRAQSFTWGGRSFEGHNNLMKFFDGADGLKTGYTRVSGYNLASSATRKGTRLIAVVMGGRSARDRDIQSAELLESEFSKLGLGRPTPVIMAMSPLVLDDEEAAAADQAASSFRPDASSPVTMAAASPPPAPVAPQAPATASIVPRDVGQGDTSDQVRRAPPVVSGGQWGIQVGAHVAREKAETQLRDVQSKMRDLLGTAKSAIVELDVRGETFFRVRFGAFTPAKAESLCDQLQKRGTSCLVVTEGPWDAADARASLPIAVR
ncbi:MAG: D-alanyl-D-alanine carboxypeptidase [Alphaproteobacteria bacterium]|nr:D-alanyl-D-alanine carboxypeptidase [Alphaproteobacteria bacterium]